MPITAERTKKSSAARTVLPAAIPAFFTALFLIFSKSPRFNGFVARSVSAPVRAFLGGISSGTPFSFMELLYAAGIVWLFYYTAKSVYLTVRSEARLKTALRRAFTLFTVILWIVFCFLYLWGVCYRDASFAEKNGFSKNGCTVSELAAVTAYFAENASALSDTVPRDESGRFCVPVSDILSGYNTVYGGISEKFSSLSGPVSRPKGMLFPEVLSVLGFTGVYFAFTGETIINTDMPRALMPFTLAHEIAHQRGVASEQECNFLGVAACTASGDDIFRYSGYLAGLLYTGNALYGADYDAWRDISRTYSVGVLRDFADSNAYWASFESPAEKAAERVYDGYLKAQGETLGIQSYDACVDMIVEYFLPKAQ